MKMNFSHVKRSVPAVIALCLILALCGCVRYVEVPVYTAPEDESTGTYENAAAYETAQAQEEKAEPSFNADNFAIEGKWKNVGAYTFGQVQKNAIVSFDGTNCNVYSPMDTYAFYKNGSDYVLDCTSFLFSETLSFTVEILDNDHIHVYYGSDYLDLERIS